MKLSFTVKCLMTLALVLAPTLLIAEVEVGTRAPNFSATDSNGNVQELKNFLGKTIVLEWTNPNCPYVIKHYKTKNMQTLQKRYTEKGVVWLTINSSAPGKQGHVDGDQANKSVASSGAVQTAYLLDHDGKIGRMYNAKTTPHMYVIDTKGKLAYAGAIDDNSSSRHSTVAGARNYVADALDAVISSQPVEVAATRAYGCSVKYKS